MRVVVVAAVAFACGGKDEGSPRVAAEQPFAPKLGELLAVPAATVNCTYVRGKVVVLDAPTRQLDVAHLLLPDDLRASTPDEVGTVAIVRSCKRTKLDEMFQDRTSGRIVRGFYQSCNVTLVDKKRGVALTPLEVNGSTPLSGPPDKDLEGERPQRELADRIAAMTRVTMDAAGPSPVAYVQVAAPRRDITHSRKLDAQQAQLQERVAKLVGERPDFEVVPSHPNDGATMYVIVPDVIEWKKTKTTVTCHATARIEGSLDVDEVKLDNLPADECLQKAAVALVDKVATRIGAQNAHASTVKCR